MGQPVSPCGAGSEVERLHGVIKSESVRDERLHINLSSAHQGKSPREDMRVAENVLDPHFLGFGRYFGVDESLSPKEWRDGARLDLLCDEFPPLKDALIGRLDAKGRA
jgi:hypothetical protein